MQNDKGVEREEPYRQHYSHDMEGKKSCPQEEQGQEGRARPRTGHWKALGDLKETGMLECSGEIGRDHTGRVL